MEEACIMGNASEKSEKSLIEQEILDFDELERQLQEELDGELSDLDFIEEQQDKIGNPDALGQTILDTVWEQFTNQIAIQAGELFDLYYNGLGPERCKALGYNTTRMKKEVSDSDTIEETLFFYPLSGMLNALISAIYKKNNSSKN